MARFIIRRLALSMITLFLLLVIVTLIPNVAPGDPATKIAGGFASPERKAAITESLGLDDSVPVQFARFVGNAVQGEFGLSYRNRRPVKNLIAERLPATLELVRTAALSGLVLAGGLLALAALPWKDTEIARVDASAHRSARGLAAFLTGMPAVVARTPAPAVSARRPRARGATLNG